jgi:hypothetical protein
LEVKDAKGNLVRTFSSKADKNFKKYDGGPNAEPVLPKSKGLNRFVCDMLGVYIKASYRGHKAPPGKYNFTLKAGEQTASTGAGILANPLYPTTAAA